jgi:hypothetical protein
VVTRKLTRIGLLNGALTPRDPGAKGGYVTATGSVSNKTTPPLQVTIFPPVTIDNG